MLTFWVGGSPKGEPRPRLSKYGVYVPKVANAWKWNIRAAAEQVVTDGPYPKGVPLSVTLTFHMPRPQAHYVANNRDRPLKKTAPVWTTSKPDVDNLTKAVLDALGPWRGEGIVWLDDDQVVELKARKLYALDADSTGCTITIYEL